MKAVAKPGELVEWGAGKEGTLFRLRWKNGELLYDVAYQPPNGVRRTRVVLRAVDGIRRAGVGSVKERM